MGAEASTYQQLRSYLAYLKLTAAAEQLAAALEHAERVKLEASEPSCSRCCRSSPPPAPLTHHVSHRGRSSGARRELAGAVAVDRAAEADAGYEHGHSEADLRYTARRHFTIDGARAVAVQ